jgi:hypothetical protein
MQWTGGQQFTTTWSSGIGSGNGGNITINGIKFGVATWNSTTSATLMSHPGSQSGATYINYTACLGACLNSVGYDISLNPYPLNPITRASDGGSVGGRTLSSTASGGDNDEGWNCAGRADTSTACANASVYLLSTFQGGCPYVEGIEFVNGILQVVAPFSNTTATVSPCGALTWSHQNPWVAYFMGTPTAGSQVNDPVIYAVTYAWDTVIGHPLTFSSPVAIYDIGLSGVLPNGQAYDAGWTGPLSEDINDQLFWISMSNVRSISADTATLANGSSAFTMVTGTLPTDGSLVDATVILNGINNTYTITAVGPTQTNSNIDDSLTNWFNNSGTVCCGGTGNPTATSQTINNPTPSLDGASMALSVTGKSGSVCGSGSNQPCYSNALWGFKPGANDASTIFSSTWHSYVASVANVNALEFDQFQFNGGTEYMFGSQCVIGGVWDIWSQLTSTWIATSVPCNYTAATWHSIVWNVHRIPGDTACSGTPCIYYDSLVFDGTTYTGFAAQPVGPTAFADATGNQEQVDVSPVGGTVTEYLDEVSFSQSSGTGTTGTITPAWNGASGTYSFKVNGGQGTGVHQFAVKGSWSGTPGASTFTGSAAALYNTYTAVVTASGTATGGPIDSSCAKAHIHDSFGFSGTQYVQVSGASTGTNCGNTSIFWDALTTHIVPCTGTFTGGSALCAGHNTFGYQNEVAISNPNFVNFVPSNANSATPFTSYASIPTNPALPGNCENHFSWRNATSAQTQPIIGSTAQNNYTTSAATSTWGSAGQNENYALLQNGTLVRFGHNFILGPGNASGCGTTNAGPFDVYFTASNAIGTVSQDGRIWEWSSSMLGKLATDSSNATRADIFILALDSGSAPPPPMFTNFMFTNGVQVAPGVQFQ